MRLAFFSVVFPLAALVSCAPPAAVRDRPEAGGGAPAAEARARVLRAEDRRLVDDPLRKALADEDPRIGDVRGPGLMIGVEMVKDAATREPDGRLGDALSARCADEGLLLLTCGKDHNIVRWIPPLDVDRAELEEALGVFQAALLETR